MIANIKRTKDVMFLYLTGHLQCNEFPYPKHRRSSRHAGRLCSQILRGVMSGFRPGDSTANQLLYLVNEIHQAFENPKSLEVRAVFLDISKAFDKVCFLN